MGAPEDEILAFIGSSFRSVWALELILLLKSERRTWSRSEMVKTLRASELVVNGALDGLVAGGLASADENGAAYAPVSKDVERCMESVARLYAARPNAVRRTIVAAASRSATAFADAFKLRKD